MIQIKGLQKVFTSGTKAIDNLNLSVKEGEILGLLGPNGAGKTTTIRVLSTLSGFDEGEVNVAGINVDQEPNRVRESIGVVAQKTGVDYFMTGRENLMLQGHLYHMPTREIVKRVAELAKYFELDAALDKLVATYSGGMSRKLDIASALIHNPKVLFLDEPTLGLDIKSRKSLWTLIEGLNKDLGLTILLTTHYLEEADKLAHRVAIINAGHIQVEGTPEELKNNIHGDTLILAFDEEESNANTLAESLKADGHVKDVVWEGNNLRLYVDNGAESVQKVVLAAADKGVEIKTLSLARPTLDDVFLKYTGTSIEGAEDQETGDEWWKQWAGKGGGSSKWKNKWNSDDGDSETNGNGSATATAEQETAGKETASESSEWQGNEWYKPGDFDESDDSWKKEASKWNKKD